MLDWVTGGVESTKAALGITKALVTLRDERLIQERVFELNTVLADLMQQLLQGRMEQMELMDRVRDLEAELTQASATDAIFAKYELSQLGNSHAYVLRKEFQGSEAHHYCCPNCFENRKRSFLKSQKPYAGTFTKYVCQVCTFSLGVPDRAQ